MNEESKSNNHKPKIIVGILTVAVVIAAVASFIYVNAQKSDQDDAAAFQECWGHPLELEVQGEGVRYIGGKISESDVPETSYLVMALAEANSPHSYLFRYTPLTEKGCWRAEYWKSCESGGPWTAMLLEVHDSGQLDDLLEIRAPLEPVFLYQETSGVKTDTQKRFYAEGADYKILDWVWLRLIPGVLDSNGICS